VTIEGISSQSLEAESEYENLNVVNDNEDDGSKSDSQATQDDEGSEESEQSYKPVTEKELSTTSFKNSANFGNVLTNGFYSSELNKLLNDFRDDELKNTQNVEKVQFHAGELKKLSQKISSHEKGYGEMIRMNIVVFYILEMIKRNLIHVPDPKKLQQEIFENIYVKWMKDLPAQDPHYWDKEKKKQKTKIFGYNESEKSARCISCAVSFLNSKSNFISFFKY
jgi:hypothetical protein